MSNVTVLRRSPDDVSTFDRTFDDRISRAFFDATFGEIRAELLVPGLGEEIERRRVVYENRLRPASWQERCAVLASLSHMIGKEETDPLVARAHLEQEADDLQGTPIFALKEAARAYRIGDIGGGKFRPMVGELRRKALEIAAPDTRELSRLATIAKAKVVDRQRPDAARRRELATQMRQAFAASRVETPAPDPAAEALAKSSSEIEARARRQRAEPVTLSDAVRGVVAACEPDLPPVESSPEPETESEP